MALPVSQTFINTSGSDVNQPVAQVHLVLGNYCSTPAYGTTVTSNGDDGSGNYPASGAIDGDRTEINIGPAAGADNNIGKSSWKSSHVPTSINPSMLTITFSKPTTITRLKVYSFFMAWSA